MVPEFFLSFLLASVISFIGSLQPGPVNLYVIYAGLHKDRRSAFRLAIGGVIPEIIYSAMAMYITLQIKEMEVVQGFIKVLTIPFLLITGILMWRKEKKETQIAGDVTSFPLLKGFLAGGMNPMLLPFWVFVLYQTRQHQVLSLNDHFSKAGFIAGTASGAFILLLLLVIYTEKISQKSVHFSKIAFNKLLGIIFLTLALIEFLR